jgi:hypothetical protein
MATLGPDHLPKTPRRKGKLPRPEAFRLTLKLVWRWFLRGVFPDLELAARLSGSDTISGSHLTLGEIARRFGAAYEDRHGHRMRPEEIRTLRSLAACRTAVCGWHRYHCDQCGHEVVVYNSCGDGHCPSCQNAKRAQWLEERRRQLLPVPYYAQTVNMLSRSDGTLLSMVASISGTAHISGRRYSDLSHCNRSWSLFQKGTSGVGDLSLAFSKARRFMSMSALA